MLSTIPAVCTNVHVPTEVPQLASPSHNSIACTHTHTHREPELQHLRVLTGVKLAAQRHEPHKPGFTPPLFFEWVRNPDVWPCNDCCSFCNWQKAELQNDDISPQLPPPPPIADHPPIATSPCSPDQHSAPPAPQLPSEPLPASRRAATPRPRPRMSSRRSPSTASTAPTPRPWYGVTTPSTPRLRRPVAARAVAPPNWVIQQQALADGATDPPFPTPRTGKAGC